jgi:hypothetical protein
MCLPFLVYRHALFRTAAPIHGVWCGPCRSSVRRPQRLERRPPAEHEESRSACTPRRRARSGYCPGGPGRNSATLPLEIVLQRCPPCNRVTRHRCIAIHPQRPVHLCPCRHQSTCAEMKAGSTAGGTPPSHSDSLPNRAYTVHCRIAGSGSPRDPLPHGTRDSASPDLVDRDQLQEVWVVMASPRTEERMLWFLRTAARP